LPIYEYYCIECRGRFQHLARRIDEHTPACPRCGAMQAERLISAANIARGEAHHQRALKHEADGVNRDDPQAMAQFLKESGRLEDASGLFGSNAYKELIARRMEGAADSDLADLVDELVTAVDPSDSASEEARQASEARQMASALALSDRVENRMRADGPPEEHAHTATPGATAEGGAPTGRIRRSAKDLGWG
jgi:putative FmdB family regulatory protein